MLLLETAAFGTPLGGPHPVLMPEGDGNECLVLGGVVDGKWLSGQAMIQQIKGGERYRLYSDSQFLEQAEGSKPNDMGDGHFMVWVPQECYDMRLAICGNWNAIPRKAKAQSTDQKVYRDAVRGILNQNGLLKSPVRISSVMRVDLEGDGTDEVLICANSREPVPVKYALGDYSLVILRKLIKGKVTSFLLCGEFVHKAQDQAFRDYYGKVAFWDVDGDGSLEIGVLWACRDADAGGISLYDVGASGPKLLVKEGLGH